MTKAVALTNLRKVDLALKIEGEAALIFAPAAFFKLPVLITSHHGAPLSWRDDRALNLSYRWIDENGAPVGQEGQRTNLPSPIQSGQSLWVDLTGSSPSEAGRYQLIVSLVLENVHWACDLGQLGWVSLDARVMVPPVWPEFLLTSPGGKALRGAIAADRLKSLLNQRHHGLQLTPMSEDIPATSPPTIDQAPMPVPPVVRRRRTSPLKRLRAWFRHFLGVVEMREAVEELLRRSAEQESETRATRMELTTLLNGPTEIARLRDDFVALRSAQDIIVSNIDLLGSSLHGDLSRLLSKQDVEIRAAKAEANVLITVSEKLAWLTRWSVDQQDCTKQFLQGAAEQYALSEQLLQRLADESEARAGRAGNERQQLESLSSAIMTHLDKLTVAVSDVNIPVLERLSQVEGALESLTHQAEGLTAMSGKLDSLSGTVSNSTQRFASEFSSGELVTEILSTLRQMSEWADMHNRLNLPEKMAISVQQIREDLLAARDAHRLSIAHLDAQTVCNSMKMDSLLKRESIALPSAKLVLSRSEFGLLAIQQDDVAAVAYYSSGELPESATVSIVKQILSPGDCFLDVGANVGAYTLLGARLVGPTGTVIAVEPAPGTLFALHTTIGINGIGNIVDLHECALGAQSGRAFLHLGRTSGHSSLLHIPGGTAERVEIAVATGTDILGNEVPTLIKIDVEGWELEVLDGLRAVFELHKGIVVIVECSPVHIRKSGLSVDKWVKSLRWFGRQIWVIEEQGGQLVPLRDAKALTDQGANLLVCHQLPASLKPLSVKH